MEESINYENGVRQNLNQVLESLKRGDQDVDPELANITLSIMVINIIETNIVSLLPEESKNAFRANNYKLLRQFLLQKLNEDDFIDKWRGAPFQLDSLKEFLSRD